MAHLDELPLEVLLNITSFLDTPDYGNLRRTCSSMEKSLFDAFAKEFFSTKQFMLTSFSLSCLRNISNHPTLASYLRKIIIGLDAIGQPDHEIDPSSVINYVYRDHLHMTSTGAITSILSTVLRQLPNCTALEVRDFSSRTKRRDDGTWRSYGVKSAQAIGARVRSGRHGSSSQTSSQVFNQVLMSMAQSGKQFESLGHIVQNDCFALHDPAFYVPNWLQAGMIHTLQNIHSFAVAVPSSTNRSIAHYEDFFNLLRLMPKLLTLRINGTHAWRFYGMDSAQEHDIISSLALAKPFPLSTIIRLELGKLYTTTIGLLNLLSMLPLSVESFGLYKVQLTGSGGHPWDPVIESLKLMPSLRLVSMKDIGAGPNPSLTGFRVTFKRTAECDDKPDTLQSQLICDARIMDMKDCLDDLSKRMVIQDALWTKKHQPRVEGYRLDLDSETGDEDYDFDEGNEEEEDDEDSDYHDGYDFNVMDPEDAMDIISHLW